MRDIIKVHTHAVVSAAMMTETACGPEIVHAHLRHSLRVVLEATCREQGWQMLYMGRLRYRKFEDVKGNDFAGTPDFYVDVIGWAVKVQSVQSGKEESAAG